MTTEKDADGKMKITVTINFPGTGIAMKKVAYTDGPGELSIPLNEFELVAEDDAEQEGGHGQA